MTATVYYFLYKDFITNLDTTKLNSINNFVDALVNIYQKNNGWHLFINNPQQWVDFIVSNLEKDQGGPHVNNMMNSNPTMIENGRDDNKNNDEKHNENLIRLFGFNNNNNNNNNNKIKILPADPMQLGLRLFLLDQKKIHIAGRKANSNKNPLRTVFYDNKIIGYIGLTRPIQKIHHPLDIEFILSQMQAIYVFGLGVLIISIFLSYYFSRKILEPIDKLITGTDAVKSFQFDIKINVQSGDELGHLAKNFNNMIETLNHYEKMRKQWMTDISHELRTPLTIIRGTIESIIIGIYDYNEQQLLSIKKEVIILNKLVEDIHMLSLADSNNLLVNKESLKPIDLLIETLELFQNELDSHPLTIQLDLTAMESVVMSADKHYLVCLFSNLLSNTLKYTDSGGILRIETSSKNKRLYIYIDDSKPGVPDEALNRLFDRLYRVEKSRSRDLGSSGLGLSICKEIVEIHEGTIRSNHSSLGGLQIVIEFPIKGV